MTLSDASLVCGLCLLVLLCLLVGGAAAWDYLAHCWNRNRWLRENGQQPDPVMYEPPPIKDYCDGCHRPIPQGETVWMDVRTGRVLHVRCREAERGETAIIEAKPDDGGRS